MTELVQIIVAMAAETWRVLVAGLVIIMSLVMLAHTIRATAAMGLGSGEGLKQAALGLIGPFVVGLFLFLGAPPLLRSLTEVTIKMCSSTFADLTTWAYRLLGVLVAFRLLKVAYMAMIAEAVGGGEAAAMLLTEAAGVIAAMLFIPFINGVAATLLGC